MFVNTYIELGVSGLITLINQDPLVSMLDKAKYYLEASGSVKEYNVYDAYLLSRIGNDLYPDEFTYRALAWRAKQANEILVAKQCMDWLLVYYDKNGI
ncbi:MAG: hypothetical protein IK065_00395, partial [Neisseriaceae bacterium]|nr:hypothetical protein [Neisseriaceae bacterium]